MDWIVTGKCTRKKLLGNGMLADGYSHLDVAEGWLALVRRLV